jgi:cytochrome c biogenesis protein CcmG/thiol:disulfide interchange protein DsbE
MRGRVWLLNVWASWCESCRDEHPLLVDLSKKGVLPILGLNYKDKGEDAQRWLARFGNPYQLSVVDADGRIGIDYGVYGVPETYLIDAEGVIRYKQIGAITPAILEQKILPLAAALKK